MEQIPTLIQDLALILLIAAVVSLLFKWLKQPVVLGYIVAGFIAGPHFIYTPSVHDSGSIDIWAQIGVIILLFTLGLEFTQNGGGTGHCRPYHYILHDVSGHVRRASVRMEKHGLHLSGRNVGHVLHYHYIQGFSGLGCFAEEVCGSRAQRTDTGGHTGHCVDGDVVHFGREP